MIYFHTSFKRAHGEIAADNIYIIRGIRGRVKFANVVDIRSYKNKSFGDDVNKFCAMVRRLFIGEDIPLELNQLCHSLRENKNKPR